MKEVKADAADLEEDFEFEVGDSAYRMRKARIMHFCAVVEPNG